MKIHLLPWLSLLLLLANSCQKEQAVETAQADYLIFGHFYGQCSGEACIELFKLEQNRLLKDRRDTYPISTDFYGGDYVALSPQQFAAVKDLADYFPQDLLAEPSRVIGQPDAGDWGGFYVEYNYAGTRQFWLLDKAKRNVPSKYHAFMDRMNEKIAQLR